MGLLGRLGFSNGRAPKIIDGQHPGKARPGADASTPTDMLPLPEGQERQTPKCRLNILVAVTGSPLDNELVALACNAARQKQVEVFAVYGIPVPRSLAVDADMPEQTNLAGTALERASIVAAKLGARLETEIVQSRHIGQSLIEEIDAHDCALVVLGIPYHAGLQGQFDLDEDTEFVLKNAPSRVWIVRGKPPEKLADKPAKAGTAERQGATAIS